MWHPPLAFIPARFFAWINGGWVKITLNPGESFTHETGGPDEEGWSRNSTTWTYDGWCVHREYTSEGRDCDGRHASGGEDFCDVNNLTAYVDEYDPEMPHLPKWERDSQSRDWNYDQYAEMAGY